MRIIDVLVSSGATWCRRGVRLALAAVAATVLSGCYFTELVFDVQREGSYAAAIPWWCQGDGINTTDLTESECNVFSFDLDVTLGGLTKNRATAADLPPGSAPIAISSNVGYTYITAPTATFEKRSPNVLAYDGSSADSLLVGYGWSVNNGDPVNPPAGFEGDRDIWTAGSTPGTWWLMVWAAQGYNNQPNVFATSHPCLISTGVDLGAYPACYNAAHTQPLEILVTNDDGVLAPGLDALVEALYANYPGAIIHVVAPAFNQSGSSDQVSPISELSAVPAFTASGRAATAIQSTNTDSPRNGSGSPADAVLWAIKQMKITPDIVISGTNEGQNIGTFSDDSGTVGAARTARRNGVPAIATSTGGQGFITNEPFDFATGVDETLQLLEEWRLGQRSNTNQTVLSINIPSCEAPNSVRGTLETILESGGCIPTDTGNVFVSSCDPAGDVVVDGAFDTTAFTKGYVTITNVTTTKFLACE